MKPALYYVYRLIELMVDKVLKSLDETNESDWYLGRRTNHELGNEHRLVISHFPLVIGSEDPPGS